MADRLELVGIAKSFAGVRAVSSVSFAVEPGEIFALVGPSGCGKSTTLRMIAGFESPDAGEIRLAGRRIDAEPPEARGIGIVFQDYALFPHLSVIDNVAFGLRERSGAARSAKAGEFVAMVGLGGLEHRFPNELSGGQQQRVALARSLAAAPRLILLDEPFSNLDAALRQATRREIRDLLRAAGIGAVFVTHDQEEALSFADRLCVMRDGVVEQVGTPAEVYARPRSRFVAGFLGRTNFLKAVVAEGMAITSLGPVWVEGEGVCGEQLLSLRPEHLALGPANAKSNARIVDCEFKGHDRTYWVRHGETDFQVDTDFSANFATGDHVALVQRGPATVVVE